MTASTPKFSLLIVVDEWEPKELRRLFNSLRKQTYSNFEAVLCRPESTSIQVVGQTSGLDVRYFSIPVGEGGNSWVSGINEARGNYTTVLSQGVYFEPTAFEHFASSIAYEQADVIYSDFYVEVIGSSTLQIIEQPEASPERLIQECYIGPQTFVETSLLRKVIEQSELDQTAAFHDLMLRLFSKKASIHRIPKPLFRVSGGSISEVTSLAVSTDAARNYLAQLGNDDVVEVISPTKLAIQRKLDLTTSVSVIIPTMGSSAAIRGSETVLVVDAVKSLIKSTQHTNFEIVVVYDTATPKSVLDSLKSIAGDHLVLVEFTEAFNFSKKCNVGAVSSSGDVLVFLNDDVEIISDDFLEALIAPLNQSDIGQVGVTMFFEDGTLQHGGHVYSHGVYMHSFLGATPEQFDSNAWLSLDREVAGVTAACTAVRRDTFEEVGGFWEHLPGNFNDVDFSLKIKSRGYRSLILGNLKIFHFESKTRETRTLPGEVESMHERWGLITRDPFFPGHLNK